MNRLRGKKLLRLALYFCCCLWCCAAASGPVCDILGAQRAFQRQYHWGPGTGASVRKKASGNTGCLPGKEIPLWWYCSGWGPFWMAEGNVPALLMGEMPFVQLAQLGRRRI